MPVRPSARPHRPSVLRPALELRCVLEAAALPWLLNVPRGNGHPVLLLPGFLGGHSAMVCHERYLRNRGYAVHFMRPRAVALRAAGSLPMPVSCLYGLGDGIVPLKEATLPAGHPCHENIRVPASHLGMAVNPVVMWIVADRLAQPEGQWQPFAPAGAAACLYRMLTPRRLPI